MNLDKSVQLFIQENLPNIKGSNVAIGYSAGADSTALLHIMNRKAKHFGFSVNAVFFNHDGSPINQGEDVNMELAIKTCKNLNVPLDIVNLNMVKTTNKSWEQIGREGRRNYYKQSNYDYIFLGHHLDDQNETTMTQLFRGGGVGVAGMKEVNGRICRPFLNIEKEEIYKYLVSKDIEWAEDPTNLNSDFTRNFWRNRVLPLISEHYPGYKSSLTTFRDKIQNQQKINYDMAVIDGLDKLLNNEDVKIKDLEDYRVNNLIGEFYRKVGSYSEDNKTKNFLKIGRATGFAELNIKKGTLTFNQQSISFHPTIVSKPNIRKKTI